MKLEDILKEIKIRKVDFNETEMIGWLYLYAKEYKKYSNKKIDYIMRKKAEIVLEYINDFYWEYDKPIKLEFYSTKKISQIAKEEYKKGLI